MKKSNRALCLLCSSVLFFGVAATLGSCAPQGGGDFITVAPEKITGKLDNPGMGWSVTEDGTFFGVLDNGETGDYPEIDAVNYTSTWALMEQQEGQYDWSLLDEAIEKWGNKLGKKLHLRISTDSFMLPSTYTGAPYWLAEKYNIPTQYFDYTSPSPVKRAVAYDVTNENYLRCLDKFLSALAEHIKGVECIGDIDVRGYGLWGEWHTGYMFETTQAKRDALVNILNHWVEMFRENGNLLVLSASWDPNYRSNYGAGGSDAYTDFYSWAALDYAFTLDNVTFRRDGAGGALGVYDKRLMNELFYSGKDVYLHGEFNSGAEVHTANGASINTMTAVNDMLYGLRANYSTILGWTTGVLNNLNETGKNDWLDRGFEKLGYRLSVDFAKYPKEVSRGQSFDLLTSWSNTGVGRFPYDHDLTVYLLNAEGAVASSTTFEDFNAKKYILGGVNDFYAQYSVPDTLAEGEYGLAVAITDKAGKPAIELGCAGQIGNSRMYKLGSVKVVGGGADKTDSSVTKCTYEGLKDYKFAANTSYAVTVAYTPKFTTDDYVLGSDNGYRFNVVSAGGAYAASESFKDLSEQSGYKTFLFTTGSGGEYHAELVSDRFGEIEIGDCYVRQQNKVFSESFASDTNLSDFSATFTTSAGRTSAILQKGDAEVSVISGEASARVFSRKGGLSYGLYQNDEKFRLQPNTLYTLDFSQKSVSASMGSYYFAAVYNQQADSYKVIGEWYDPAEMGVTNQSFTFTTDGEGGTLVFGLFNAGEYVVDDICIVNHGSPNVLQATSGYFPRNEVPDFGYGLGVTEDFESGALSATGFRLGNFNMFKLTKDPEYVINGKYSALMAFEKAQYESLYFELMWTNNKYYTFEGGATYEIKWKVKEINLPKSAKAYFLFRDRANTSYDTNNLYTYFAGGNPAENSGTLTMQQHEGYKEFTWTITLKDISTYELGVCFYNDLVLVIDDITITKK